LKETVASAGKKLGQQPMRHLTMFTKIRAEYVCGYEFSTDLYDLSHILSCVNSWMHFYTYRHV